MIISFISRKELNPENAVSATVIKPVILELILSDYPGITQDSYISIDELNKYRRIYLANLIIEDKGELAVLDKDVVEAIKQNTVLSEKILEINESNPTLGQKLADKIALFGGSWAFIIFFFSFIIIWMGANIWFLSTGAFDPYPFILLNLILSCLASIQAPIIMMSQNRQEQKDRLRNEQDYKINLKAELEIRLLSEKIDHLLVQQNKKLIEIQEIQMDYFEDLIRRADKE